MRQNRFTHVQDQASYQHLLADTHCKKSELIFIGAIPLCFAII
jgi:hypothetical protein